MYVEIEGFIIPAEYADGFNPDVLREVGQEIDDEIAREAAYPIKYQRYIEMIANHIRRCNHGFSTKTS